jgi:hypothetical protein
LNLRRLIEVSNSSAAQAAHYLPGDAFMSTISTSEISRLQTTLRRLLGAKGLSVNAPPRPGLSVELAVDGEVIGTIHRDDDEGEVSYAINIILLEEDLPPAA